VVVERLGKFDREAPPGILLSIPFVERLHLVDVRERCISVNPACAFTSDNVEVHMAGTLFARFEHPETAVYGASEPLKAIEELARSVMRTKIGKRQLNEVFESRKDINLEVVDEMALAAEAWGARVYRFEITELEPADAMVSHALHTQATAQREKLRVIAEAEADRERVQNEADAEAYRVLRTAEAFKQDKILRAEGESEALRLVGQQMVSPHGEKAMEMQFASKYIESFEKTTSNAGSTIVIPASLGDPAGMLASALTMFRGHKGKSREE
jgi:regulator of protease activity HflC (stomatin/prohibitin superfamily)